MEKKAVVTTEAPKAIGPYNQAIIAGGLVYCSGQIPLDPKTGSLVVGGVDVQTRRVLTNLSAVLAEAGSSLDKVVKTTVYLKSMNDFKTMNEIYAEFFNDPAPARATVQVAKLPLDVAVEIDCIAIVA